MKKDRSLKDMIIQGSERLLGVHKTEYKKTIDMLSKNIPTNQPKNPNLWAYGSQNKWGYNNYSLPKSWKDLSTQEVVDELKCGAIFVRNEFKVDPLWKMFQRDHTNFLTKIYKSKGSVYPGIQELLTVSKTWEAIVVHKLSRDAIAGSIIDTANNDTGLKDQSHIDLMMGMNDEDTFMDHVTNFALINDSTIFHWIDKTFQMAMKMPLPEMTITKDLFPEDNMFVVFEHPVNYANPKRDDPKRHSRWLNLSVERDINTNEPVKVQWSIQDSTYSGLKKYFEIGQKYYQDYGQFTDHDNNCDQCEEHESVEGVLEGDDHLLHGWIKLDSKWPDELQGKDYVGDPDTIETVNQWTEIIVKFLAFINTKASSIEDKGMSRAEKRRIENPKSRDQYVKTINLRRIEHNGRALPSHITHGDGSTKKYMKSHWVTGHYKKQAYGIANSLRKVIFIEPYIRGKGDPETDNRLTVYKVRR
jgi:hypothetical protein